MFYLKHWQFGEIIHVDTLATKFNIEVFPEDYSPPKTFLFKLADLYNFFLDTRVACLHWFHGKKGVMYTAIALGQTQPHLGEIDTATGKQWL